MVVLLTQALFAEQMLRHSGERSKADAIASKRAFIEQKMVCRSQNEFACQAVLINQ